MLPSLTLVLSLLAAPELKVPSGSPITLDGRIEQAEWSDAFSVTREIAGEGKIRFHMQRTGAFLAFGLECDRTYRGEVFRFYVADELGSWCCALFFGIGQPSLPPLLWRRGPVDFIANQRLGPEAPRGCLARVHVTEEGRWSAEYLVRLATLGIGRGDQRTFRALASVGPTDVTQSALLTLPDNAKDMLEVKSYATLISPDSWGGGERWEPVTPAQSREFDDNDLLWTLYLEHDRISMREVADRLVISNAVRPRSMVKINALRRQIEQGRARNPTLPAYTYFLGRLLHEGNLYAEARTIIESVPGPLRTLDPFVNLEEEHLIDTERWQEALDLCAAHPDVRGQPEAVRTALNGRRAAAVEAEARAADAAKSDKNPRVKIVTTKGEILCELFEDDAPAAVNNFMDLAVRGHFYDGLAVSEALGGLMVRIGDPSTRAGTAITMDGPEWRLLKDKSPRAPLRGTLATVPVPGNAHHGSQFMITVVPMLRDARQVAVFGRVIEGIEVVEALEEGDRVKQVLVVSRRNHAYDALIYRVR